MSNTQNKSAEHAIQAGYTLDYISGKPIKESKKEQVRQRIVRALIHEYGFSPEDMALDYKLGGRKKVDVAIFHHGKEHTIENLGRAVVCRQEPKAGKGAVRIRDFEQAAKDLDEIESIMCEVEAVQYGLWTNGLEFFFLEKEQKRFETKCNPIGDWPIADESIGTKEVISDAYTRVADNEMLKITFRRCHNFIHGNEGMPKDAAFWQFLYLIFCKMHDENLRGKLRQAWVRRFWAGPKEQFEAEGRKAIRKRIEELFTEVKKQYSNIFRGNEEITLSDRALAFIVSELAKYDFTRTDVDAKGVAYQELVGVNLRGDRGQYFTPRGVVKLVIEMLDPKESETVLDPSCGTGGFLVATLGHMLKKFRDEAKSSDDSSTGFLNDIERLKEYAGANVYGADFDPFLIRAAQMNMVLAGDGRGHIYNINSLEFPLGHLADLEAAKQEIPLSSIDIIATNPPFGSDIPITDKHILEQYELAHSWESDGEGGFRNTGVLKNSVSPEILFIERCIKWLKPGSGRLGIVLPDGVLGNPAAEYIRWWIMRETQVLASVDLPVESFIAEANVNILTSLLFLRRKDEQEKHREALGGIEEYPVFMAVADKVGFDRRGNKLYKRTPDGEEIVEPRQHIERIRIGGRFVERTLTRSEKIEDNDLPVIAEKYREFQKELNG
ncbi:methylation-associated defense system DNA methyltransferase MAD2 [Microbulbifer hydrolyticus]|uniref:N-6 DNA methylase n=1 Tax=Microbulbifer hydrolyticus TaxID=48074 RepID=A0A6P1T6Y3_9GAMM|nr:N-6 DNA methylase [Microbulbifer hydrolyticus]MBB5211471.1 type I restriction enzyme M protein [Microbulbifer hydrolyticus]QHQ37777.1 N-6 DNA methylase [Microbulbifer hydrolyticus]